MSGILGDMLVVVTTVGSEDDARRLAKLLVEKRLCACAQIYGPITSYYWWDDKLEEDTEWQVKFKLLAEKYQEVQDVIKQNHPYELPQIIAFPVENVLDDYAIWVAKETNGH